MGEGMWRHVPQAQTWGSFWAVMAGDGQGWEGSWTGMREGRCVSELQRWGGAQGWGERTQVQRGVSRLKAVRPFPLRQPEPSAPATGVQGNPTTGPRARTA